MDAGGLQGGDEPREIVELAEPVTRARGRLVALGDDESSVVGAPGGDHRRDLGTQAGRVEPEGDVFAVLPDGGAPDAEIAEVSEAQVVKHCREAVAAGNPDRAVPVLLRTEGRAADKALDRAGEHRPRLDSRGADALHRDVEPEKPTEIG